MKCYSLHMLTVLAICVSGCDGGRSSASINKEKIIEVGNYDSKTMITIIGQGTSIDESIKCIQSQLQMVVNPNYRKIEYVIEKHISVGMVPSDRQYYLITDGYINDKNKSAQQGDAPEPATNAISASQPSISPAR